MFAAAKLLRFMALGLVMLQLWPPGMLAEGSDTVITATICAETVGAPTIASLTPSPTPSSFADISGVADPDLTVTIFNGSTQVAQLTTAADGSYAVALPLHYGINSFKSVAGDNCGHTAESLVVTIDRQYVIPVAPVIEQPADNTQTQLLQIEMSGHADADSLVSLRRNGTEVATVTADSTGAFSVLVDLLLGSNSFTATATNPAGTGPISAAVTVTRVNPPPPLPPVIPGQPPVSPRPGQAPTAPLIVTPSNGEVTSAETSVVEGRAEAESVVRIYRNGQQVARVLTGPTGIFSARIPLVTGDNRLAAIAGNRFGTSPMSVVVVVKRELSLPAQPVITAPLDHATVHEPKVLVKGRADPNTLVTIRRDGTDSGQVISASDGTFAISIPLRAKLNTLVAVARNAAGVSISPPIDVFYDEGAAGGGLRHPTKQQAANQLLAAMVGLRDFGNQVLDGLINSSSALWLLWLLLIACFSLSRGLAGLELIWLLMAWLIQQLWHRRKAGARLIKGRVVDRLTSQPVTFARISRDGSSIPVALTNSKGRFSLWLLPENKKAMVHKFNYGTATIKTDEAASDQEVLLEPVRHLGLGLTLLDTLVGSVGWLTGALVLGAGLRLYETSGEVWGLVMALMAAALLFMNGLITLSAGRLRWGRVVDLLGRPVQGARVELVDSGNQVVSSYVTGGRGDYTLHAPKGSYIIKVAHPSLRFADEPVVLRRHASYFGFRLRPTPKISSTDQTAFTGDGLPVK
jgi:hypothetical protein